MPNLISTGFSAVGDLLGGIGNAASDAGNAAADRSQASAFREESTGDLAEATAYGQASAYALQNKQISQESTKLQKFQTGRQVFQTIGAGAAAAGNNGLTGGGSAKDILRSSASQGALVNQVIGEQGIINETAYEEQSAQYVGMQQAAQAASKAALGNAAGADAQASAAQKKQGTDLLGGIVSAAASIFAFL